MSGIETTISFNLRHRQTDLRIFEVGQVSTLDAGSDTGARETTHIAFALQGSARKKSWLDSELPATLFHLKGDLAKFYRAITGTEPVFESVNHAVLENVLALKSGELLIGVMGELPKSRR
ncbi:MAG: hypothetical protein CO167_02370, partial [Candidatus Marinimicrobia bacterium CG_4_9_14_3_um_filter_48_9]